MSFRYRMQNAILAHCRSLWIASLFALGIVFSSAYGDATPIEPPNIVLIMADDMGWGDLSCYGSEFHETPNIDQLYAEGVAFTNGYSSAPLCSATRAAMMTGWAPARHTARDQHQQRMASPDLVTTTEYRSAPRPVLAIPRRASTCPRVDFRRAFWLSTNFGGRTSHVRAPAPCQWVDLTGRHEVQFTAPGRLARWAQ